MYGANAYGQGYYAQGPADSVVYITKTVSATVTTVATISAIAIINKILNATVTTTASILRQINRSLNATVTVTATITSVTVKILNLINGFTKFLLGERETRLTDLVSVDPYFQTDYFQNDYFQIGVFESLSGLTSEVKHLDPIRTTRIITE